MHHWDGTCSLIEGSTLISLIAVWFSQILWCAYQHSLGFEVPPWDWTVIYSPWPSLPLGCHKWEPALQNFLLLRWLLHVHHSRKSVKKGTHLKKTVKKVFPNFILSIVETIVLYFTVQTLVEIKEHAMLNDRKSMCEKQLKWFLLTWCFWCYFALLWQFRRF